MNQPNNVSGADRGLPSVNDAKPKNNNRIAVTLFIVLVLSIGGAAVYWTLTRLKSAAHNSVASKPKEEESTVKQRKFDDVAAGGAPVGISPPPPQPEVKVPAVEPPGSGKAAPIGLTPPGGNDFGASHNRGTNNQVMTTIPVQKVASSYDSPFVVNGGVQPGGATAPGGGALGLDKGFRPSDVLSSITGSNMASSSKASDGGKGALQGMLTPTNTPTVKAGFLGNRSLTVSEGTGVNCVLRTRIVAMKPGFVICSLIEPLRSADGKVILADRGSKVTGEQSGSMKNGETRLYVLWRRIETEDGVIINIDAPATDSLGGSGIDGEVDNHWSQRIGASLMLSLINDAFAYEIAKVSSNGSGSNTGSNTGTTVFQNTTQSGNKIAEKVLDSTINIPPTLYRNQGDQIMIMIPRDLDFSSVYDLQPK